MYFSLVSLVEERGWKSPHMENTSLQMNFFMISKVDYTSLRVAQFADISRQIYDLKLLGCFFSGAKP